MPPVAYKLHSCPRCSWEGKALETVAIVFHTCRPKRARALRMALPDRTPTTLEEAWARGWEGFAPTTGPMAPLFHPDEDRMRAETDGKDGYHHDR